MVFADGPGAGAGAFVKGPLGSLEVEMVARLVEQLSPGVCSRPCNKTCSGSSTAGSKEAKGDQSPAEDQRL